MGCVLPDIDRVWLALAEQVAVYFVTDSSTNGNTAHGIDIIDL
jgi:hypothetical protein